MILLLIAKDTYVNDQEIVSVEPVTHSSGSRIVTTRGTFESFMTPKQIAEKVNTTYA